MCLTGAWKRAIRVASEHRSHMAPIAAISELVTGRSATALASSAVGRGPSLGQSARAAGPATARVPGQANGAGAP